MMTADPYRAALAEIIRRAAAVNVGERLVGGPRAVAFDLGSVAAKALGIEFLGPLSVEQHTWEPPEERPVRRRAAR